MRIPVKIKILVAVLALFTATQTSAQIFSDTLLLNMRNSIYDVRNENENIKSRLDVQSRALNDISKTQSLTDKTKWEKIRVNVVKGVETYKILSDDLIDLKSQVINQDYQGFIKRLSSVKDGPLGFSFDQVIMKIAQSKAIFDSKPKNERFMNTLKALSGSPLVALIPFASQAVTLSSSALNVAYAAGMQDKKVRFEKIKEFENELNRYIAYYTTLDRANIVNTTSNTQTLAQLETLQLDLLDKFKKDAYKMGYVPRAQRPDESLDDYFNHMTGEFAGDYARKHIGDIETKYKSGTEKVNLGELLQSELNIRTVNNNLDYVQDLVNRFVGIHDAYFDMETKYFEQIKNAVNVAKANGIIQQVGEKPANLVYEDLVRELNQKKGKKDQAIKSSINIKELKERMDAVDIYKIL
ncbi:MAG: hypothetical protein LH606_14020 [Cytophagaceae bacterium]|nr:hypothetical protein [Cytophagaceae bacterium]